MRPDDVVDLAREPHPAAAQHQQVVTDPVQLGEQVRGQHDGGAVLGGLGQQQCGDPVPYERIEAGQRLVQQQEFGPPGEGEGEPEEGALPAGEGADPGAEGHPALLDDALGAPPVPAAGVELAAQPQRVGDRQPGVERLALGEVGDPGAARGGVRGRAADPYGPLAGADQAGGQREQGGLPGAAGPDQGTDTAGRQPEGAVAQRPAAAVAPAEADRLDGGAP